MDQAQSINAFCPHGRFEVAGASAGPLAGLTFAAKDLFDVAGHKTGAGNPDWLKTHEPAKSHAPAVKALLDAGATLVGKTISDELAYGMTGRNIHYGTPVNPAAPDRLPGGSSSGSAAVVAAGLADFALGSDTGGSVRVPASYCGLYGIRPSHGRVSLDGVVALAPSFDTVGWFARDPDLLTRVARVLFGKTPGPLTPKRLLRVDDAFGLADPSVTQALQPIVEQARRVVGRLEGVKVCPTDLAEWYQVARVLQAREAWVADGSWIQKVKPKLAEDVKGRFDFAAKVTASQVEAARAQRVQIVQRLALLFEKGAVMCLPSTPTIAPRHDASLDELSRVRDRTMALTCIAGLAGLPQVTVPAGRVDGAPVGFSLLGPKGSDLMLLRIASEIAVASS